MRSDFEPVHLKEANAKLDKELASLKQAQEESKHPVEDSNQTSLWNKLVGVFKRILVS